MLHKGVLLPKCCACTDQEQPGTAGLLAALSNISPLSLAVTNALASVLGKSLLCFPPSLA